ncbi:WD40/YVTN/BNR-like repeat-containing protein [Azospirillum sp.]|uniref:WD40/YVTN/BNR-like repeat-containing protein n=1 Tax=Azospirillum sp. TaxID=34012 RepID=UPI002D46C0A0|nr:YCF48-related protein [Azospirillum sp.]HYD67326.1 YCF48-related protein [Azospirillum sp.]
MDRSFTSSRLSRRALLAGFAAAVAAPSAARAGKDLLDTPAFKSDRAARALLLGVTLAGTRVVAVGERGIIVTSDDQGSTWRQAAVPVSVTLTAVHFPTAKTGWAVGHDGVVLHSADGGASWTRQFDGNQANTLMLADAKQRVDALRADPNADKAALEAAEMAAEDAVAGAEFGPSRPLLGVWFRDEATGFAVGSYGQIFRTRDGGRNWQSLGRATDNLDGLHFNAIAPAPSGALLIAGEGGRVYRSTDGGEHWETHDLGTQAQIYGVRALPGDGGAEALLAFGFGGKVFRCEDGQNWQALPPPTPRSLVGSAMLGTALLLVDQAGAGFVSDDGGRTFRAHGRPAAMAVTGVAGLSDGKWILVGMGGARVAATAA